MNKKSLTAFVIVAVLGLVFFVVFRPPDTDNDQTSRNSNTTQNIATQPQDINSDFKYAPSTKVNIPEDKEIATFAGGCFWCVEAVFQETDGVDDVISGFGGGREVTPTYEQVVRELTEHRETIQFTYDPTVISYDELLDIYWQAIDPTDAGGQFVDRGFIYTTAVYYHDEDQRRTSIESIEKLRKERDIAQVATELLPFTTFYPAEEYHQDYYKKASDQYKNYESNSGREEYRDSINSQ